MSTKSTIAHFETNQTVYHLYSECFNDMIFLDYAQGLGMQVSLAIPLKFALELSEKLTKHLQEIKMLVSATEEDLQAKARENWARRKAWGDSSVVPWIRTTIEGTSDEQGIEDCYVNLKERQTAYLEMLNVEENS
jgi:hypothetical protein